MNIWMIGILKNFLKNKKEGIWRFQKGMFYFADGIFKWQHLYYPELKQIKYLKG